MNRHRQHVSPYIEFTAVVEQQIPNVTLNDQLLVLPQSCAYISEGTRYENSLPAIGVLSRLHYPNVIFLSALLKYLLKLL